MEPVGARDVDDGADEAAWLRWSALSQRAGMTRCVAFHSLGFRTQVERAVPSALACRNTWVERAVPSALACRNTWVERAVPARLHVGNR